MIRVATDKDINTINKLAQNFISNFKTTYNIKDYLLNNKYVILVNVDEEINAFLIIYKNIDYYEIEMLYVDIKKRKQHIATDLINFFMDKYYNFEPKDIILEVAVDNKNAIKLYQNFDFDIINIRSKYYSNVDAYVMKRVKK